MGVIYKITSPSGRIYVGQTSDFKKRYASHKHFLKKGDRQYILYNSFKKHGFENHKFEIIEEVPDEKLNEREVFWIKELNTCVHDNKRGMNMTPGGESGSGPWMHDIERRKKQAQKFSGVGNPFFGKQHTEEFKIKKSKEVSEYNKKIGWKIPEWGVIKGRLKVMKPIVGYDSSGNFIGEFQSFTAAAKLLNISIEAVRDSANQRTSQAKGYHFKYKIENYPLKIEIGRVNRHNVKRTVLLISEDFEVMAEYPSALEASIELQVPKTTINRACQYNWLTPIRTGHVFIYRDLWDDLKMKEIV